MHTITWAPWNEATKTMGEEEPTHIVDPKDDSKTLCGLLIPDDAELGIGNDRECPACKKLAKA